ncbi:MAG: TIR domain-containing protein [Saccharofermentans sp.]|nr:TIR domain-containing protein [Saccharofermentans sp.]
MIDHYDAFISYRHAPLDIKVAEHIQRNLEFFYIPHNLRKKTGKKRISRIFRDKSELANTSDLSDTIANALEKSDYLIVICSKNTKESFWVDREIEFFLKNHTKKQILTVLCEGEPAEVIPRELQHDIRKIAGDDGEFYEVDAPTEPLSCDYRMPWKKAKKEELPRLAAAIIGCSYDELVRRQRAYRIRRAVAIAAVLIAAAFAFSGYMLYSKQKVDAALRQALENRSIYLANSAGKLLDEKDRIGSLYLAMEAVPKDGESDYPVTPDAFHALSNATLAYCGLDGLNINNTWNYSLPNQVRSFELNEDGSRLAALDSSETVTVWDTQDHFKIMDFKDVDNPIRKISFPTNDTLITISSRLIRAFNAVDGEEIWKVENEHFFTIDDPMQGEDSYIYVCLTNNELLKLDIKTGAVCETYDIDIKIDDKNLTYDCLKISPDRSKIAFTAFEGFQQYHIGVYDLKTGKKALSDVTELSTDSFLWEGSDRLIIAEHGVYNNGEGSTRLNSKARLMPYPVYINCLDTSTLKPVWSKEQICVSVYDKIGLVLLKAQGMVAMYAGNKCCAYDFINGDLLYDWDTNETIINANDRDGDGFPMMFTERGAYVNPLTNAGNNAVSMNYCLPENIRDVEVNKGIYLRKYNGRDICYFTTYIHDEDWNQVKGVEVPLIYDSCVEDNVVAFIATRDNLPYLVTIDTKDNSFIREVGLTDKEYSFAEYKILFADKDNIYLSRKSKGMYLVTVPIEGGEVIEKLISEKFEYGISGGDYIDGKLAYFVNTLDDHVCCLYDIESGKTDEYEIEELDNLDSFSSAEYCKDMNVLYLTGKKKEDLILDLASGNLIKVSLPEGWDSTDQFCFDKERSQFIISDGIKIIYVSADGKLLHEISCDGMVPAGLAVAKDPATGTDMLIVPYNDGVLCRYDLKSGEFIASSRITCYSGYTPDAFFEFDYSAGILYITMDNVTDIIDLKSWKELSYVNYSLGHCKVYDRFYTYSYETSTKVHVGYFKHYTLQDLIDKAKAILKDEPIPEVMRAEYGI